jgi:hypothetical protein
MANKHRLEVRLFVCKHCGHVEQDHYMGWGDCNHGDCVCVMYEPTPIDIFDYSHEPAWTEDVDWKWE